MNAHSPAAKTAIVIGAGFGGLALAIRLQSAGIATTLVEARDKPGGRAYVWHDQGHVFDAGPTVITDPDALKELWALTGQDMARDVTLMPVSPFYRLMWPGGKVFDYVNEADQLERQIAPVQPGRPGGIPPLPRLRGGGVSGGLRQAGHRALPQAGPDAQGRARADEAGGLQVASMPRSRPSSRTPICGRRFRITRCWWAGIPSRPARSMR